MPFITTADDTRIFYRDSGTGPVNPVLARLAADRR